MRGRVKFRVGRIVYLAFSRDETLMGFAFPKEERDWLVGTEPEKFLMPRDSDLRYNWVVVRLAAIDADGDARARHRRLGDGRAEERLCALPGMSQWQSAVPESTTVPDVFTKLQL